MIIRTLNKEDVFQHERVASQAFVFSSEVDNAENELPCETMLGAFCDDNKTLMADMEIEMRNSFFFGNTLSCAAVGGVASKPEYRNKGSVRALFNELFNNNELKADISILYPFSAAYYNKFGYESLGRAVKMRVPFSLFGNIPKCSDVFLYEGQDNERFFSLYNCSAVKNNLAFERINSRFFTFNPYESLVYTYVLNDYSAYVTFCVDRNADTVYVKEIEYLNFASLLKILGFLRAFEGNQKFVEFSKLSENSPIVDMFFCEKNVHTELSSTGAARVLDVESVLSKRAYPITQGSFAVKCNDTIEKNTAVFSVEYENGKAEVSKCSKEPDIILDPCAFSQLFLCGIRDRQNLAYKKGVEILKDNPCLFDALSFKPCFVNDEF